MSQALETGVRLTLDWSRINFGNNLVIYSDNNFEISFPKVAPAGDEGDADSSFCSQSATSSLQRGRE